MPSLPRAILFDLDETLISSHGNLPGAWQEIVATFADALGPIPPEAFSEAVVTAARAFWGAEENQTYGRLHIRWARQTVVARAFEALGNAGYALPPASVADSIADRFSAHRTASATLFPESHEVLEALTEQGVRLGLITNGASDVQRAKIHRFGLLPWFDHIQIEGEHPFGKPDPRAYEAALAALDVAPSDAWIVGDNLEWEVVVPQRLGLTAIWVDRDEDGVPDGMDVQPDKTVQVLTEILSD